MQGADHIRLEYPSPHVALGPLMYAKTLASLSDACELIESVTFAADKAWSHNFKHSFHPSILSLWFF
jgi:hypothetical protein